MPVFQPPMGIVAVFDHHTVVLLAQEPSDCDAGFLKNTVMLLHGLAVRAALRYVHAAFLLSSFLIARILQRALLRSRRSHIQATRTISANAAENMYKVIRKFIACPPSDSSRILMNDCPPACFPF